MDGARSATIEDLAAVASLARAARGELAVQRGDAVWEAQMGRPDPVEAALAAAIEPAAERCSVVGTVDDVVVGYGMSSIEVLGDGSRLAVVTDLYVDPQARGIGIGEAMMDLLVDLVHGQGIAAVVTTHDPLLMARADRVLELHDGRLGGESRRRGRHALDPDAVTAVSG